MALIEKMHDYKLRAHDNLDPPVMKTPTILGEPGTSEFSYRATLKTIVGETTPTEAVSISNAPTVLDSGNCVKLEIESAPAGTTGVNYYKLTNGAISAFRNSFKLSLAAIRHRTNSKRQVLLSL